MALKLDLSKAYDRMEWEFLRRVMSRFGFARRWIDLIMQCVTTVRYSFLVRGKPRGCVVPTRGLRQGDPLSPYLFLLRVEGFSALLQKKQSDGLLSGIEVFQDAPSVNHLFFADDSMLYAKAELEDCYQIQEVLETYGRASGQLVNFDKSSVVFSKNVTDYMQGEVADLMGVEVVDSHEKYLGLPTYVGRKKSVTFQYIKEHLAKKLENWQGKLLSGAGKNILIRVVAQSLSTYAMSVFQLTNGFCEDIEQMCARFWWGSTTNKRKIHWRSWDFLCNSKEEGGLGFRSLAEFNSAMLAKQAWRIINHPNSLIARIYAARYFPSDSFWTAGLTASPSYSWRNILSTRELIANGFYWQIGNGEKVKVWCDPWIPGLPSFKPELQANGGDSSLKVSDLFLTEHSWDERKIRNLFSANTAEAILCIPLSSRRTEDRVVEWLIHCAGKLSKHSFEELLVVLWNIWKERNTRVLEHKRTEANDVVIRTSTSLAEYRLHNIQERQMGTGVNAARWRCPAIGVLKVNIDGSFHAGTKIGGLGFIIRDSQGVVVAGGVRPLRHLFSAEHAEALACFEAVKFVLEHNLNPVIIETDSQVVQRQVSLSSEANSSMIGRVYEDIVALLSSSPNLKITHTKREANQVAHRLATHATTLQQANFFYSPPSFLMAALAVDSILV
ncbi:uncharacterized protein LOC112194497 [Rosa chinensis]|uniref:uncharacterized protein LOC112194497 n=1 Tax=Rosa chinensis TaxID=74649 RepID=UPI000D092322|nr:uncharacterized protein LOC112194497 [Rosa chinensis]